MADPASKSATIGLQTADKQSTPVMPNDGFVKQSLQPSGLNARGVEQVAEQVVQPVGLFLNGLEPRAQRLGVPMDVFASQC